MRKIIVILTALCIALAYMPIQAFADETTEDITEDITIENEAPAIDDNTEITLKAELQEPLIKNAAVKSNGLSSCTFSWDKTGNKVKLSITYGNNTTQTETDTSSYYLSDVPFGETVTATLTTDDLHKPVILKCNPSEDFRPSSVKMEKNPECRNKSKTDADYYCKGVDIYTKSGAMLGKQDYSFKCSKAINKPGEYNIEAVFKGKYAVYEPLPFVLTVTPTTPTLDHTPTRRYYNKITLPVTCSTENSDYIITMVSASPDFSNPITQKVESHKGPYVSVTTTGLKANTKYYVRLIARKMWNCKAIDSAPEEITIHTAQPFVKYLWNQQDVKNIVSLMKKNKSFKYTFKGHYDKTEASDFLRTLGSDYAQYADRYKRDVTGKDDAVVVTYTLDTKELAKCKKATKVVNSIVKGAKKKKSVKAKVKYINKRLCKICSYDYKSHRNRKAGKKVDGTTYTFYGCLVKHKAVCSGYAEAFRIIAVQCGIPNEYDISSNHKWNKVKIGNTWYHVDVTWNDCTHSTKYLLKKTHKR